MKPVLILQHQIPEHAAYLTTWLDRHGIHYEVYNAGTGEEFPQSIEPYSAMAVMGGGMSSNDPLLSNRQTEILILQAVLKDIPVIGHCLGGQLMSRALGAKIGASPQPEIGWQPIDYTADPAVQKWFGLDPTPMVIQWHYESFGIPEGATLLASSDACTNQAWAMGPHLAMQFHIEMDQDKAKAWADDEDPLWAAARTNYATVQDREGILAGIEPYLLQHQRTADHIYNQWLSTTEWAVECQN
jgi:GMP synthase-like glutamine amidotransferase